MSMFTSENIHVEQVLMNGGDRHGRKRDPAHRHQHFEEHKTENGRGKGVWSS